MFKPLLIICLLETGLCIMLEDDKDRYYLPKDCKVALFNMKARASKYFNGFTVIDEKCIFVGKET